MNGTRRFGEFFHNYTPGAKGILDRLLNKAKAFEITKTKKATNSSFFSFGDNNSL